MPTIYVQNGVAQEILPDSDVPLADRYSAAFLASCQTGGTDVQPGWIWNGTAFLAPVAPTPTLADRLAALAAERYTRATGGVMFQAAGAAAPALVASDEPSQAKITSAYQLAKDGHWVDGAPWKMADGSFVPMTAADVQAMAVKIGMFVGACFAHEAQLAASLASNLSTDITQVWPANA